MLKPHVRQVILGQFCCDDVFLYAIVFSTKIICGIDLFSFELQEYQVGIWFVTCCTDYIVFKRSANAFSLNANVDVRRRHLEIIIFFNILKSIWACNSKIYHNVAFDSLYILTRNDISSYFPSAANLTNVLFVGYVQVANSRLWFNRFWKSLRFWKEWFKWFISRV